MTKETHSTADQLRTLMNRHVSKAAAPTGLTNSAGAAPAIRENIPAQNQQHYAATMPRSSRQSLRLLPNELSKIDTLINNTFQQTGQRATVTDILRVGLRRLGESSHITPDEIIALRASDGRRIKAGE